MEQVPARACRQSLLIEKALLEIVESVRSQLKEHDRKSLKLTVEEGVLVLAQTYCY